MNNLLGTKTGEYKLTPLRNVGALGFYGDKMYYMIQTGSFDLFPLYVADSDGNNSTVFNKSVWKFEIHDNILYYCAGISESYDDYDRGIIYKHNLDTGEEIVLEPDIKVSTRFEEIVKSDILKEEK